MNTRYLIVRRLCPHCRVFIKIINSINMRLPIEKQIRIIDAWEWEELGIKALPILKKLEKDGLDEGYPFLYISGCVIQPAPTPEQLKIAIETLLMDDLY